MNTYYSIEDPLEYYCEELGRYLFEEEISAYFEKRKIKKELEEYLPKNTVEKKQLKI